MNTHSLYSLPLKRKNSLNLLAKLSWFLCCVPFPHCNGDAIVASTFKASVGTNCHNLMPACSLAAGNCHNLMPVTPERSREALDRQSLWKFSSVPKLVLRNNMIHSAVHMPSPVGLGNSTELWMKYVDEVRGDKGRPFCKYYNRIES